MQTNLDTKRAWKVQRKHTADAIRSIRRLFVERENECTCSVCESGLVKAHKFWSAVKVLGACALMALLVLIATCRPAQAYTDEQAIRAIMGEGESESYLGKLALASTIKKRGHLRGVCALKNVVYKEGKYYKRVSLKSKYFKRTGKRLRLIPNESVLEAVKAWKFIKKNGIGAWQATGWGTKEDLEIFKCEGWFKNCVIVDRIGNHFFYKEVV